jgi:hypothetical protein
MKAPQIVYYLFEARLFLSTEFTWTAEGIVFITRRCLTEETGLPIPLHDGNEFTHQYH